MAAFAAAAFAQEDSTFKVSGEAKTGIYWESVQTMGKESEENVKLHSKDDAGSGMGRFRVNMDWERADGFGMRMRFTFQQFRNDLGGDWWSYGFGYGNFFERQLTVSVGRLGGSPWGTGGPEMWKELEEQAIGMRVEFKPAFIPEEFGRFNVGFVLNDYNSAKDQGWPSDKPLTLLEILSETVMGLSYTHDNFMGRFSYRGDGDWDLRENGAAEKGKEGGELVYRLEERALKNVLPGFQIWALGYWVGLGADSEEFYLFQNWLFTQYDPPELFGLVTPFTAQFRVGFDYIPNRSVLHLRPNFYWHFLNKLISVGAQFLYAQDFGDNRIQGEHPFIYMEVEPKIQLNFQSSYIAFVYNWRREYFHATDAIPGFDPIKQTQFMNLRFCIYY
jgi:hypothetical protein